LAVCRLHHEELLDASHILPDKHAQGEPWVCNGLSLCKLHHAAFDANIIGVRPDLVVEVREDILEEHDGPMLKHGLKECHERRLVVVPRQDELKPRKDFLEERYEIFRTAT
jgi:putative restriction endonuclease